MKGMPEERAIAIAKYMIENKTTVRQAAIMFGISKSTVHKDITTNLIQINKSLYMQVRDLMEINKKERHIRGGKATKEKYMRKKQTTHPRTDKSL